MELCVFVYFSQDALLFVKLKLEHFTPSFFLFFFSTYRTQFLKQNLVKHKIKKNVALRGKISFNIFEWSAYMLEAEAYMLEGKPLPLWYAVFGVFRRNILTLVIS